jgi:CRISPR system Cascade subunit CasA
MIQSANAEPKFNLWSEAWLSLERSGGPLIKTGIEQALLDAHHYNAIYELSPLAVAGIFRMMVAILQAALNPQKRDLRNLWQAGEFPIERIKVFGQRYAARFDLFSQSNPFLQSADLPAAPVKGDNSKTVAYLAAETSPASAIDHYRHEHPEDEYFCPACAASALLTIPPFMSIGGRGYRPSINGIPPLYMLPVGSNLFESLMLSLILPTENYWPSAASRRQDLPWWEHPPIVEHSIEVNEIGYLHSLTFPARRIRLHPIRLDSICTRCGLRSAWGIRTMLFEMGECRPKDSALWLDPFIAYRVPDEGKPGYPWAIRPDKGKALWREYAGLFLSTPEKGKKRIRRPAILDRIAEEYIDDLPLLNFRCIGVRMDQAKVLEWVDASFGVPARLMNDNDIGYLVRDATLFADSCADVIARVFRSSVNTSRLGDRHKVLKEQMLRQYWAGLANSFRGFILSLVDKENQLEATKQWATHAILQAQAAFEETVSRIGDDAVSLRQQEQGKQNCQIRLALKRKKYLEQGVIA